MIVSRREEELARELYNLDMGQHQGDYVQWTEQIELVQNSYRRQASRIVNTKWFARELVNAAKDGVPAL